LFLARRRFVRPFTVRPVPAAAAANTTKRPTACPQTHPAFGFQNVCDDFGVAHRPRRPRGGGIKLTAAIVYSVRTKARNLGGVSVVKVAGDGAARNGDAAKNAGVVNDADSEFAARRCVVMTVMLLNKCVCRRKS